MNKLLTKIVTWIDANNSLVHALLLLCIGFAASVIVYGLVVIVCELVNYEIFSRGND